MKKNKFLAVILAMAVAVGAAGVTTYAVGKDANDTEAPSTVVTASASDTEAVKDETVYVMTAADGSAQKILVSDWIKNALPAEAQKAIESLNDAQQVKDDCWTGTIQKELPVSMSIHYTLDGKTVTPSELAGKSGKVTIRFEYENNQYEVRTVNGVSQKVYVPFVALTGALLDTSHFSNVTVSNGKLINDGDRIAVMGMAFPGLQEDLGISKEQLDLPDYVEISADVTDFTLETTLTVVSNSLLNEVDTDDLTSGDLGSLSDSLGKLTDAMDQLMDGSSQLYDGLCTLLDSCGQLSDGVDQLTDGLDQLSSNSSALNAGAKQVFTSLLTMADEQLQPQLAQEGITIPSLTIDNYTTVLGGVLAQLDEAGTLAEQAAREQVTAAVEAARDQIRAAVTEAVQQQLASLSQQQLAMALEYTELSDWQYEHIYNELMPPRYSDSTYDQNMELFGYVDMDSPDSINLYATTFSDKDEIARIIDEYNASADEEQQISYTDYVAILMSSISTIINAISYVLIAFVAISLVVSSIMIGIITYISVLERTKEIGILRAIGASKRDVSNVFNAETLIEGLAAGLIGIGLTLLLNIPINAIVQHLTGIESLRSILPVAGAVILIVISMLLTFIAGLIPSRFAAKRDPVEALRTE